MSLFISDDESWSQMIIRLNFPAFQTMMSNLPRNEIETARRIVYDAAREFNGLTHEEALEESYNGCKVISIINATHNPRKHIPKRVSRIPARPECQVERTTGYYQRWKKAVKARDNYTCKMCGSRDKLHVHHIKSVVDYPELATELSNGITLCNVCHKQVIHLLPAEEADYFIQECFL